MKQSKKPSDLETAAGIGLALGSGVGTTFGIIFNNMVLGTAFGATLGLVFGSMFGIQKASKK